jgi:flagellar basal-body rod modification protein FlgD
MIDNVVNYVGQSSAYNPQPSKSELGKDDFLHLMIEQMKHQDPMNPLDGTQFTAQLAQFSSLEQLSNMNELLNNSINANYQLIQAVNNTMTATLIGKEIKIGNDTISYTGQDQTYIGYNLPADASKVTIKIYDENGALVKTIDDVPTSEGNHKIAWDFTDDNGDTVDPGSYTFSVEATAMNGEDSMVIDYYQIGVIEGIKFTENGTMLIVNGNEVPLGDVMEIFQSDLNLNNPQTLKTPLLGGDD